MNTINNKIICEPFLGGKGLKAEVKNGFAMVKQKNNLVGLRVLMDCLVSTNSTTYTIKKNSKVFFSEEVVHNGLNFHNPIDNKEVLPELFIIADLNQVILICES